MNITKTILSASLLLVLLPAGQAFASAPQDPGAFQTKCMGLGGTFGLANAGAFMCDLMDGTIEVCDFAPTPACVTTGGPTHHSSNNGPKKVTIIGPVGNPGVVTPAFP